MSGRSPRSSPRILLPLLFAACLVINIALLVLEWSQAVGLWAGVSVATGLLIGFIASRDRSSHIEASPSRTPGWTWIVFLGVPFTLAFLEGAVIAVILTAMTSAFGVIAATHYLQGAGSSD